MALTAADTGTTGRTRGDDRLDILLRLSFTPLALFTAVFGPLLVILPGSTDDYWAWRIRPDLSAVWVGAGYTFGALAITTMLVVGRWRSAIVAVAATFPFAIVMAAATLLHRDRFFQDSPRFWVWAAIYVALPLLLPVILLRNRPRDPGPDASDLLLPERLRLLLVIAGGGVFIVGLYLFLAPGSAGFWPWTLTPLMSRVVGGWLTFIGAGGLCAAFEPRYVAYRYFLPIFGAWFGILLVASFLNKSDFKHSDASEAAYFAALVLAISAVAAIFLYMEIRLRAARAGA